jgi:uncharacterized protein (TIGR03437 family)
LLGNWEKSLNFWAEVTIDKRTQAGGQYSEGIDAVHKILKGFQFMYKLFANKILLATSALLLCAGFAQAQTLASPLTATPTSVSITYTLPSTPGGSQSTVLSVKTGTDPFVIDATTVPFWLSTQDMSGNPLSGGTVTASSTASVYFAPSAAAGSLPGGVYTAPVGIAVNGYQELVVTVSLTVIGTDSTLSVLNASTTVTSGGTAVPASWTYGSTTFPTITLTLLSSNDPIEFSAVSAVSGSSPENWIQLSSASGIAYNFGTSLTISFAQDALINSAVSATPLTGTVTITYGSSTFVVNVALTIAEPLPTVTKVFPQEIPSQSSGAATVVITGTGFGTVSQGYTTPTTVTITYGASGAVGPTDLTTITSKTGSNHGSVTVENPNTMILSIPFEDGTTTPTGILTTVGQNVTISITNGITGETTPVSVTLYITSSPVVYSVTDAGALVEPTPGKIPNVAPYEVVSIFGNNFCPTCSAPVVAPVVSSRYPTTVTAASDPLTVTFYKADGTTVVGDAYLLFVSDTQINAIVPSTVVAADDPMQVVVSYNGTASNTNFPYSVNAALANPGIFTTSSTGQGQGAILNFDLSVNSSSNKVAPGKTIVIYATGLGTPNSTAADTASTTAAKFPTSCISAANYVTAAALASPATADGAVLIGTDIQTNKLPPCFATANQITVSVGGLPATVTYAGWVSGSVTGLYQINATVPTKAVAGNLPVLVTVSNGTGATATTATSQAGVTVAVN